MGFHKGESAWYPHYYQTGSVHPSSELNGLGDQVVLEPRWLASKAYWSKPNPLRSPSSFHVFMYSGFDNEQYIAIVCKKFILSY